MKTFTKKLLTAALAVLLASCGGNNVQDNPVKPPIAKKSRNRDNLKYMPMTKLPGRWTVEDVLNDYGAYSVKKLKPYFKKANVQPRRFLYEVRVVDSSTFQVGQKMDLQLFVGVSHIDVTGQSKGKGYQGVIKKHGFSGGPASHGSGFHRHAGSTGMRSSPGRCLPGGPRPSHMGDEQVTVQNLRVISIDLASNVMLVEGAVPGGKNGIVVLSDAVKKTK